MGRPERCATIAPLWLRQKPGDQQSPTNPSVLHRRPAIVAQRSHELHPALQLTPTGFHVQPTTQSEVQPIHDFIYLSEGLSNSYLITTPTGRIAMKTGWRSKLPCIMGAGTWRHAMLWQPR
jgi:hypothetical protein